MLRLFPSLGPADRWSGPCAEPALWALLPGAHAHSVSPPSQEPRSGLVGRAKQLSSLIKTLDLFWGGRSCCAKHLLKEAMEQLSSSVPPGSSGAWGAHSRKSQVCMYRMGGSYSSLCLGAWGAQSRAPQTAQGSECARVCMRSMAHLWGGGALRPAPLHGASWDERLGT